MNRERELAKNTFILTVGKISTQFISFLLLPLYTSLLTPEDFGIVDLLNTYVTLLVPIFNWQFESGMFRFLIDYRDNVEKQKSIISTVLFTNFAQILIYVVFFIIAQGFVSFRYKIFLAIDISSNNDRFQYYFDCVLSYGRAGNVHRDCGCQGCHYLFFGNQDKGLEICQFPIF